MDNVWILGGLRSFIGVKDGMYRKIPAEVLGARVLKEIKEAVAHFERTPDKKIDAGDIDKMLEGFIKESHRSTGA